MNARKDEAVIQYQRAEEGVRDLLRYIGEDPSREGLLETPRRVVKALMELTEGYRLDPKAILSTTFAAPSGDIVVVRDIPFSSLCEHHLLLFSGTVNIGYLPSDRIVGLSKLARLVDCLSKRLQVQERLTHQIAEAITDSLDSRGVGVIVTAEHSCMSCRGARKPGATMTTTALRGALTEEPHRTLFLSRPG